VSAIWRTRRHPLTGIASVLLVIFALLAASAAAAPSAAARSAAGPSYVKYYVVQSTFDGQPEDLAEIAARFLDSAARSTEIFDLNKGRPQPAGGELTNPAVIDPGWVLVLPWDAVGPGVQYGLLPTAPPAPARPTPTPTRRPSNAVAAGAGTPQNNSALPSDWGMLRMAPQQAWPYSRGAGVTVAIVDSGVDASLPELAGRVTAGDDIIPGTGRGNTDYLGSGTAMAGIVAARSVTAGGTGGAVGMAPAATIIPVRVAPTKVTVPVPDQVRAIQVAVSADAKVLALGGYIDPADPAVASAIGAAASHDVVVVAGAPTGSSRSSTASGGAATTAGVIWVGAINIDGAPAANYQPGAVDVVAPGVDVAGLSITGTGQSEVSGTPYAVAFAAGEAALVRARYPDLTAAQVVRRIETTADRMGSSVPDPIFGWGLIDPEAAVTSRVVFDQGRGREPAITARSARAWSPLWTMALAITAVLALIVLLLLALRIRRMVRLATGVPSARVPAGPPALGDELAATAFSPIGAASAEPGSTPWADAGPAMVGPARPAAAVSPWAAGHAGSAADR
jgi:membrane-anchored mycosin MYCP